MVSGRRGNDTGLGQCLAMSRREGGAHTKLDVARCSGGMGMGGSQSDEENLLPACRSG